MKKYPDMTTFVQEIKDSGGFQVLPGIPASYDRPDDMATAWLAGDMPLYEKHLAAHLRKVSVAPEYNGGRPKYLDRTRVKLLVRQGYSPKQIVQATGYSRTQIWRIINDCRSKS